MSGLPFLPGLAQRTLHHEVISSHSVEPSMLALLVGAHDCRIPSELTRPCLSKLTCLNTPTDVGLSRWPARGDRSA
jgi:hypothetical protein